MRHVARVVDVVFLLSVQMAMALSMSACLSMDAFMANARHCSVTGTDVDPALCEERRMCTPCDEPYPFEKFGIDPALVTQVTIPLEDGETNDAYFITSTGARADTTLFYFHGNFGSIEHYMNRVALLVDTGAHVFVVDYRGFGKSSSKVEATEAQYMSDIRRARVAMDEVAPAGTRVVLYGYSAGSLGSIEVALSSQSCGMILENPWPSVQAAADDSTFIGVPQPFLTIDTWDNIAKMPDVVLPLFVMHAAADTFVQERHGRAVFEAAASPDKEYLSVAGADHGNFGDDVPTVMGLTYLETVNAFVDRLDCN